MEGYIYRITSPNTYVYVGQTINLKNRLQKYKSLCCKPQPIIYNSIVKYGWDNHILEILESDIDNYTKLDELEIKWKQYHLDLVNNDWSKVMFCKLNDKKSGPVSPLTRIKMSESAKNADNGYKIGHIPSKKTTLKIGQANLGRKQTQDSIDKRRKTMQEKYPDGFKIDSDIIKEKVRKMQENGKYIKSQDSIDKRASTIKERYPEGLPIWNKGKSPSPETIEKNRQAHLGKKLSIEQIEKQRKTMQEKYPKGVSPEKNIKCEIDGVFYESVKIAASSLYITESSVYYRINSKNEKYKNYIKI